jgi:hypothetical protein
MAVWSPQGETPVTRVDPGRKKVGFYGTLNLRTGEELVTRTENFSSQTTTVHLQFILEAFPFSISLCSGIEPSGIAAQR